MRLCNYIAMMLLVANTACAAPSDKQEASMQQETQLNGTHPLRELVVANNASGVVITKAQGRRLQAGDVIERVNGVAITSVEQLQQILQQQTMQWKIEFKRGDERFGLAVMP